jgi:periplasmic protein TonB
MSYLDADAQRSRTKPIIAVAIVHAAIAYAFISGLAMQVVTYVDTPITARNIPDEPPPPTRIVDPPRARPERMPDIISVQTEIPQPNFQRPTIEVPLVSDPVTPNFTTTSDPVISRAEPQASLARRVQPIGDRGAWVSTDDYPPAALREGAQGVVGITLAIGADGRVAGCEVTSSSGSTLLDDASCRFYARRARFTPALDEQGHKVASRWNERVRWQLPRD